jgi:hypothetical protein
MKTSDGGLIGKTYNDTILEKAVGLELALVFFRKPSWPWQLNLAQAQDPSKLSEETQSLPPMALFASDWMERAINICAESGIFSGAEFEEQMEDYYYKGNELGFIFGVPASQIEECFMRGLFGASMPLRDTVFNTVQPGSPLFLLDLTNNLLQGVFQATSEVGEFIDPQAFLKQRGYSKECLFPVQVRAAWILNCMPIPDNDPALRKIFGGRDIRVGPLSMLETKQLVDYFAISCGAHMSSQMMMGGIDPHFNPSFIGWDLRH